MPHSGLLAGTPVAAAVVIALAISLTRKGRFRRAVRGILNGSMAPDLISTSAVAASTVVLAALGVYTVLCLPVGH